MQRISPLTNSCFWTLSSVDWGDTFFNSVPTYEPLLESDIEEERGGGHFYWKYKREDVIKQCIFKFTWRYVNEFISAACEVEELYTPDCSQNSLTKTEAAHIHYQSISVLKLFHKWERSDIFFNLQSGLQLVSYTPRLCNICKTDMLDHQAQCMDWLAVSYFFYMLFVACYFVFFCFV